MNYRTNYYDAPPRRRVNRFLLTLTIFVWFLVFSCIVLRGFVAPFLNDFVYQRVAQAIRPNASLPADIDPRDAASTAIAQAPLIVPQLQQGEFRITEEQATQYMTGMRDQLGVNSITVQFVPDQIVSTLGVNAPVIGEVSGTARTEARAEDGRVRLTNPRIDGPIGAVISPHALVNALENRLNSEVEQQGRRVTDIDIQDGVAVVTVQ